MQGSDSRPSARKRWRGVEAGWPDLVAEDLSYLNLRRKGALDARLEVGVKRVRLRQPAPTVQTYPPPAVSGQGAPGSRSYLVPHHKVERFVDW